MNSRYCIQISGKKGVASIIMFGWIAKVIKYHRSVFFAFFLSPKIFVRIWSPELHIYFINKDLWINSNINGKQDWIINPGWWSMTFTTFRNRTSFEKIFRFSNCLIVSFAKTNGPHGNFEKWTDQCWKANLWFTEEACFSDYSFQKINILR